MSYVFFVKMTILLLQLIFIVRFHLEISQVNAHTEPANTIRKITNPFVLPIKRLIPFGWAKKFAAIKIAYLIAFMVLLIFASSMGIVTFFLQSFFWLARSWLFFLQYGIFIYVIASWIQVPALQRVNYFLYQLFEPVLRPIRQIIPSFGGIDFSPMILLFGLSIGSNLFFGLFN